MTEYPQPALSVREWGRIHANAKATRRVTSQAHHDRFIIVRTAEGWVLWSSAPAADLERKLRHAKAMHRDREIAVLTWDEIVAASSATIADREIDLATVASYVTRMEAGDWRIGSRNQREVIRQAIEDFLSPLHDDGMLLLNVPQARDDLAERIDRALREATPGP